MTRSYTESDLVTLPRLDAAGASTLANELLTQSKGKKFPTSISNARKALADASSKLDTAVMERLKVLPVTDPARTKAADLVEDAAFSATHSWLTGFSKLPYATEQGAMANQILDTLFRDGLKFTQIPYKLEWAEANWRLQTIEQNKSFEDIFKTLGGDIFLKTLRKAHKEYGEALGITSQKQAEQAAVLVQEPLANLLAAMRKYVLRVLAHADSDDAESMALADSLLEPLVKWTSPTAKTAANPTVDSPPPPPAPAQPTLEASS